MLTRTPAALYESRPNCPQCASHRSVRSPVAELTHPDRSNSPHGAKCPRDVNSPHGAKSPRDVNSPHGAKLQAVAPASKRTLRAPSSTCTRQARAPVKHVHPSSTCTRQARAPVKHVHPSSMVSVKHGQCDAQAALAVKVPGSDALRSIPRLLHVHELRRALERQAASRRAKTKRARVPRSASAVAGDQPPS